MYSILLSTWNKLKIKVNKIKNKTKSENKNATDEYRYFPESIDYLF